MQILNNSHMELINHKPGWYTDSDTLYYLCCNRKVFIGQKDAYSQQNFIPQVIFMEPNFTDIPPTDPGSSIVVGKQ